MAAARRRRSAAPARAALTFDVSWRLLALVVVPHYRVPTSTGQLAPLTASAPLPSPSPTVEAQTAAGAIPLPPASEGHVDQPVPPVGLSIPVIGVSEARVVPVATDASGSLGVPDNPQVLGWWSGGAKPKSSAGTVVIDGHVDTKQFGAGVLYRLETVAPGAVITLQTDSGSINYLVDAREVYRKDRLPAEIFTRAGAPRLAVITCGGPFNARTREYAYNVVVFASPA